MAAINRHMGFSIFWDAFCISTLLGIWPRFIEPFLVKTTHLTVPILTKNDRLKIVQISDLHFNPEIKPKFLNKVIEKIAKESPDLIVITGDFICNGSMSEPGLLRNFLKNLKSKFGIFAVLGNHDYNFGLNINADGDYDIVKIAEKPALSGIKRLLQVSKVSGKTTQAAEAVHPHPDLFQILEEVQVKLLDNCTVQIDDIINLTGLGELMAGSVRPEIAFKAFDKELPGVVLVHNPDGAAKLKTFPGDLILSGHTHGGQINLPWIWKRFTAMENPSYKSGLYQLENKRLYISRGVGGVVPFRFNAVPEIVSITLTEARK